MRNEWVLPTLACLIIWGIWGLLPKFAVRDMSPGSVFFWEAVGCATLGLLTFTFLKFDVETTAAGAVYGFCTGFIGLLGGIFYLFAVRSGPVALVSATTVVYPAITIVLAALILGESLTAKQMIGVAFALGGALLVTTS